MVSNFHQSVLLNESVELLNIKPNGVYVDCTFGRGGHSKLIYSKLSKEGKLICFDQDNDAILYAKNIFSNCNNVIIIKSNFSNLKKHLAKNNIHFVDGFIFDLGLSSPQLDDAHRGFSYHKDARLDMRMDVDQHLDAYQIVNYYTYGQLCDIFREYGEIKEYKDVARAIVKQREKQLIATTLELVDLIKNNVSKKILYSDKHPARLFFQAIRIAVNDELNILEKAFDDAISLLNQNGVVCVISFHSLEDKITKQTFLKYTKNNLPKEVPLINYQPAFSNLTKKIKPSNDELQQNNRARSSILRAIVKN